MFLPETYHSARLQEKRKGSQALGEGREPHFIQLSSSQNITTWVLAISLLHIN